MAARITTNTIIRVTLWASVVLWLVGNIPAIAMSTVIPHLVVAMIFTWWLRASENG